MSRIGRMPIKIPEQTDLTVSGKTVVVNGSRGTLELRLPESIEVVKKENEVLLVSKDSSTKGKAIYGLTRALLANVFKGVSLGFRKELELSGVGYRAQTDGSSLTLTIGFSHPVKFEAPQGIKFAVVENKIIIEGVDKQLVGKVASQIRSLKPPEPYKGKGIKYLGEKIRRKAGKAAKTLGGTK